MRDHSREKDNKEEKVVEKSASRSNSSKYSVDSGGSSGQEKNGER
jgi:hypothetical protein